MARPSGSGVATPGPSVIFFFFFKLEINFFKKNGFFRKTLSIPSEIAISLIF
jgi:hypothetical protein